MQSIEQALKPYKVYVQTDKAGCITAINSSAFTPNDWGVEIDTGFGDRYHHAQRHYLEAPIYTDDSIPRYKLVDGKAVERTEDEIAADRAALPEPEPPMGELLDILLGVRADG